MSITKTLQKIGLSEKEVKIYLTLLKHGEMKPSALANLTKISRPLVYSLAKDLLSKGLITEDISGKILHFVPLPPTSLEYLIDEAKREVKEKENLIRHAINDLGLITTGKQYPIPKVKIVEEKNMEKFLFDNITKWQDAIIASDGVWWGYQDHQFVEKFGKWISATWQTEQSKHPHYKAQVLTNTSAVEQMLEKKYPKSKRDMRPLPEAHFTATTWVCGDYLIMIMNQEHPYYLLEIHDKLVAQNTAEIFKNLWQKN